MNCNRIDNFYVKKSQTTISFHFLLIHKYDKINRKYRSQEMHFFKNSVSFIAVMSVCGVALAAVAPARVGVVTNPVAMRRLPSLSNVMKSSAATSATTTTSSSTSGSSTGTGLIDDAECVNNYRDCMKGDNACGSGFEECTTNVLFHGHMSECISTLYQCSPAAIERLLGTSNIDALSNVDSYVAGTNNSEVARYTYPTDGSVMGIDIIGAATRNKLNTSDCVKKYKRCLAKDNVCGEDFELCTSADEFKRQAAMCDSTLARCQKEGFQQLFGEKITTKPSNKQLAQYTADGDVHQWVEDGAALAASNAVNTCYKVVDTCFANACAKNPYSCVEDVDWSVVNAAQSIVVGGLNVDTVDTTRTGKQMAGDVRKFFRAACTDTIGSNQYCYMTFNDGKKPTKADLQDEDLREDVFGEAYASRKTILTTKVNELVKKFDSDARNKCIETFKSCAVHSCGGGSGAACYSRVFGNSSTEKSINGKDAYSDIENGCAAIVNTDANCRHMAAMQGADTYTFEMGGTVDTFGILFPTYQGGSNNNAPIVSALNADLSTSYNAASIEQMKRQCQNVVSNCVKSMCGKDYMNCYRNRNDISLAVYDTGDAGFDKSMNKVGGVLDYTIVQGLCASTVKSADACGESLAIAKLGVPDGESSVTAGWGTGLSTIGNAWNNSAKSVKVAASTETMQEVNSSGKKICDCTNGGTGVCADEEGGDIRCTTAHMISRTSYVEKQAINTVFQDVLADVEAEAQAQYKAKLTKEQNVCLAQNPGANPNPTFVWAKLKGNNGKLPKTYASHGFGETTVESNDLYKSFCRVKVTLQSEDRDLTTLLSGGSIEMPDVKNLGFAGIDWLAKDDDRTVKGSGNNESTVYFAAGDAFTCGSWVSEKTLDAMSAKVGAQARKDAGQGSQADKNVKLWTTLGVGTLGAGLSAWGYDALQSKSSLGGFLNKDLNKTNVATEAKELVDKARSNYNTALRDKKQATMDTALSYAQQAKSKLVAAGLSDEVSDIDIPSRVSLTTKQGDELTAAQDAVDAAYDWDSNEKLNVLGLISEVTALATTHANNNNSDNAAITTAISELNSMVNAKPTSVTDSTSAVQDRVARIVAKFDSSKYNWSAKNYDKDNTWKPLKTRLEAAKLHSVQTTTAREAKAATYGPSSTDWDDNSVTLDTAINELQTACNNISNDADTKNSAQKKRIIGDVVAGAAGGIATAALANGIVSSAQKAKYENAENAAVKEWMENIGSKIHCYINGELVGDFGDIVTVNITED